MRCVDVTVTTVEWVSVRARSTPAYMLDIIHDWLEIKEVEVD